VKVSELGEFGLIERLAQRLASQPVNESLIAGIGDDAGVWRTAAGATIATTDTLVAGVHFLPERAPWPAVGWKAIAVNVSDIAAMGGTPDFALVTLMLPVDFEVEAVDALYNGIVEAATAFGVTVAGGDIVRAPVFSITVALTGTAALDSDGRPLLLRRDAGREGDVVAVTGALGGSAGGLRLQAQASPGPGAAPRLIERHLRPQPRLGAGRAAIADGLRCAIDISDGLLQDLGHICDASGLGAVVRADELPIEDGLADLVGADEALRMAATGGEDYELLLCGPAAALEDLRSQIDVPLSIIGELVEDSSHRVGLLDAAGAKIDLPSAGWDHLA
jgi:thiamine-monophosphate kinase